MIHDDDAAAQLDRYLDRLVSGSGRDLAPNGRSSGVPRLAETVHARDATDPGADPRPDFLDRLKEQLEMHFPSVPASIPGGSFSPATDHIGRPRFGGAPTRAVARRLRHPAFGAVATAALLVITLLGVYVSLLAPREERPGHPAAAPFASPGVGTPEVWQCESTDPYFGCAYNALDLLGHGLVQPQFLALDDASRGALQVQLQGWVVAPGETLVGADASDAAQGVVIDVVLSGTYVATFDVPVVVAPGSVTNDQIQYLDAGTPVELGRNDTVVYRLGGLVEIYNPLSTQRIEFKRAVFYDGDISTFSATADGITTRVEGDATLPEGIGAYEGGMSVTLWYVHVRPQGFPPSQWEDYTIIGPVDPQRGPEGTEGFVLTVGRAMG